MARKAAVVEAPVAVAQPAISPELQAQVAALVASELAKRDIASSAGANQTIVAEALAQFSANQKAIVETQARKNRSLQEMIAEYPAISVFNPRGERDYPRPTHFRKVNGIPRICRINGNNQADCIDRMTVEEITSWDAITENCACRNNTWRANVKSDGNQEVVDVILPTPDRDKRDEIGGIGIVNILFELRTQGKIKPDMATVLNRMFAQATDSEAFLVNLERLLNPGQPVA